MEIIGFIIIVVFGLFIVDRAFYFFTEYSFLGLPERSTNYKGGRSSRSYDCDEDDY